MGSDTKEYKNMSRRILTAVSLLVLPILLAFNFQLALEAVHPLEEVRSVHPDVDYDLTFLHDPSEGGHDEHDLHFCAHSHAFCVVLSSKHFFDRLPCPDRLACVSENLFVPSRSKNLDRGPPILL